MSEERYARVFADEVADRLRSWEELDPQLGESRATCARFDETWRRYLEPWSDLYGFPYLRNGTSIENRIEIDLEIKRSRTLFVHSLTQFDCEEGLLSCRTSRYPDSDEIAGSPIWNLEGDEQFLRGVVEDAEWSDPNAIIVDPRIT